ncbi:Rieske (2Fe-2S) protein [Micromonospora carbonacea]|uniref:Ferredoxin subunit of nitrite reductase or a ring-hydroxylating dioxygenase n=1 Tax=Micromonospora carbonacea TaxID=47853 RepID=A0A1C4X9K4_9ACTN|nr:Rieske (2Fe-2S) protein [Micromonospora carbonacea]SCF05102.1 Ferredoxin subunit of nitrite reductase or a ring-hydroxylating dioxygenase [Micromonospora carbonacea]
MSDEQVQTGPATQTRRALLAGAGALGAAVVLSACGGDDSDDSAGGDSAPSGGAAATGGTGDSGALASTADVPVGGGLILAAKGVVITQPEAGTFKGFDPICTHQGCPVSNVDGGTINCTCHMSKFSITDGSVKSGPATTALAAKELKVDGDQITLA